MHMVFATFAGLLLWAVFPWIAPHYAPFASVLSVAYILLACLGTGIMFRENITD